MKHLIIIVNWNNRKDTEACIQSVLSALTEGYHILLIDNGSEDTNWMQGYEDDKPLFSIIYNQENLGFTPAVNQGFEYAMEHAFDDVVLLNNDTTVTGYFFVRLDEILQTEKAHMISCKLIREGSEGLLDNVGHKIINTGEIVPIGHNKPEESYNKKMQNIGSCAAATVYSAELLRDIGYFDSYFQTGYEDAEFGLRATLAGYESWYFPELEVYHKVSLSVSKIDDTNYRIAQQKNMFYTYFKLMPLSVILINLPFLILKYILVFLVELLTFRFGYFKIHFKTFAELWKDKARIGEERRQFFRDHRIIPWYRILIMQEFFLWYDMKRLYDYVFRRRSNVFDKSMGK